jgi:uncharacterized protein
MKNRQTFAGRFGQLQTLTNDLEEVRRSGTGRFVLVRGRRQVGKSRLIEEFVERSHAPSIFFSATKGRDSKAELREFAQLIGLLPSSTLGALIDVEFNSWDGAFQALARAIEEPTIVVVDEFPYLVEGASDIEGSFQKAWDRSLKGLPIVLILIGSDLAMMDALTEYGRPLYGRPSRELHLDPLNPSETASLTGLDAVDAFDAYLVTGGFPNLVNRWTEGQSLKQFLGSQLATSSELIVVAGERTLAAEFPPDSHARSVLSCIGNGFPNFSSIASQTGIASTSLDRALKQLLAKGMVVIDLPTSALERNKETRYRLADPYLAFWLRFLERAVPLLDRGRSDQVLQNVLRQWPDFRGAAIEPTIRECIARLLPIEDTDAHTVGKYWTRDGSTEVDVVGVNGYGKQRRVSFVGSMKWRANKPFTGTDAMALAAQRSLVPGTDDKTVLLAVSSSGFKVRDVPITLGPAELLAAWDRRPSTT